MPQATAITLNDVAQQAGVSPATVSRCLNSPDTVKSEKREKVEQAIRLLGYVPFGAARALASRKSRMIGAIFPSIDNALFGCALEVLQHRLAEAGYTVVVASSGYDEKREEHHIRTLLQNGVDALMLVGTQRSETVYRLIKARQIPYVTLWRSDATTEHPNIGFDNAAAAEQLTDYLIDLGHRRFACFSGLLTGNDRARDRVTGIRRALEKHGLELDEDNLWQSPFGVQEGRNIFRQVMRQAKPPSAIICGSEPFAYGAIFEAAEMGIDVPSKVSIAGFDDLWLARQIKPRLTTMRTPQHDIAANAVDYLLARLAGEKPVTPPPLTTQLIIRKSTAAPPKLKENRSP